MCNCKQVEATFNKFEPIVNKPSDGDLYGYENIVKTSWDDDGLFDISVPSFSINILLDSDTNEFVGDLHIKHPKEENLGWNTITFKNKDYLLLCHRLLDRCYYECFARVIVHYTNLYMRLFKIIKTKNQEMGAVQSFISKTFTSN